ncbi:hypothetical protein SsS58_08656 [Streptomyces scabiei]|uniref:Uncharacterized protein n=1 Tax=Streptomyces scabiei TaxID=1930 RepID=A0A124C5P4_STRSC|nr:hypothetical protein SsS58_08656 [Streptomyces scabiei]
MPSTTSASLASSSAAWEPVEPMPPTAQGWSHGTAPLPAWVSATGIPVASAKARSAVSAPEYTAPPPATISGFLALRSNAAARSTAAGSGTGRPTCHTRRRKKETGQSWASACTSCGSARVTAPVSTGSVSTRIAARAAGMSCSGRETRSKYFETALKASLTVTSPPRVSSSCCSTGSAARVANMSEGRRRTGSRLVVASAAPVIMLVEPGPVEAVQANAASRSRILA